MARSRRCGAGRRRASGARRGIERLKRTIAAQPPASLSRAFHGATPDARMLHLRLLTDIITEPEREALLESLEAVRRHFT